MVKIFKQTQALSFLLLSLSIFTYQNLLGPTFSTLLTGLWQTWVVIPSFLGIGLGIWISVTFFKNWFDLEKTERVFVQALFFSFICVFMVLNVISKNIDQQMLSVAESQTNIKIIENLASSIMVQYIPLLLLLVSIPFILFGVVLGTQFSKSTLAIKAYQLELIGLIIGSVLCIWLLEAQSWSAVVKTIVSLSFFALLIKEISFLKNKRRTLISCAITAAIFIAFMTNTTPWQLQRNLNLIARDFHQKSEMQSLATRWKSFAKVQLLKQIDGSHERKFIAVGDGTGIARFFSYDEQSHDNHDLVTVRLATFANPKKVAVLFAGAAAEVIGIHKKLGNSVETWAVEINSAIPAIVAETEGDNFTKFFKKYNSHYVISDNRRFLEESSEKFDSIIYSWSGATIANFSGATLHTTQYSFTTEALKAATSRLQQNGILIILGGNKLNIIKSLKFLESQGSLKNIRDKILLFSPKGDVQWKNSWDDYILVFKNQDWTTDQIKSISSSAEQFVTLVYDFASDQTDSKLPYGKMLSSFDVNKFADQLWQTEKVLPTLANDDFPFAYRNFPTFFNQGSGQWISQVYSTIMHPHYQALDGIIWISFFLIIIFVISLLRKDITTSPELFQFLAWAPVSSSCLLFYLYKTVLYFGDPTVAFLVVQVATQFGSFLGLRLALRYRLTFLPAVYITALLILASNVFLIENQSLSSILFNLNHTLLLSIFFLMIGLTSCLFSFYFISVFSRNTEPGTTKFGLFWTFETLLTGLMGLVGAFLIEEQGIKFFVLFSIFISCTLLFSSSLLKKIKIY